MTVIRRKRFTDDQKKEIVLMPVKQACELFHLTKVDITRFRRQLKSKGRAIEPLQNYYSAVEKKDSKPEYAELSTGLGDPRDRRIMELTFKVGEQALEIDRLRAQLKGSNRYSDLQLYADQRNHTEINK